MKLVRERLDEGIAFLFVGNDTEQSIDRRRALIRNFSLANFFCGQNSVSSSMSQGIGWACFIPFSNSSPQTNVIQTRRPLATLSRTLRCKMDRRVPMPRLVVAPTIWEAPRTCPIPALTWRMDAMRVSKTTNRQGNRRKSKGPALWSVFLTFSVLNSIQLYELCGRRNLSATRRTILVWPNRKDDAKLVFLSREDYCLRGPKRDGNRNFGRGGPRLHI